MAGLKFTFTGDNQDVLKKINQIQTELKKVYNRKNTKIDLSAGIDFSLLGENFKRLDQQSREAFDNMSKDAQKYVKEIQENILSLQQVEKMQAGLNSLYEDGDIDLNAYIQSQARLTVLHEELAKGINENRAALEAETTTTKIAADSIAGLHAKVLMLTTDYMNLSKAQREGTEGAALLKNLQETQTQLDNASLSMDKYASGAKTKFDSLGMSITQIARELPSLAMGPQMFFLAISNNLGPFQDALSAARKEYKDAIDAGQKGIPVWKQLLKSLTGAGPILAVTTTLFVAFGDKIFDWIGTSKKAEKTLKKLYTQLRDLNNVLSTSIEQSAGEVTKLNSLYKIATDVTKSTKERNNAVKELKRSYPEHLKNLSDESIKNGEVSKAIKEQTNQIIANAKATAAADQIAKNWYKSFQAGVSKNIAYITKQRLEQELAAKEATVQQLSQMRARPESYAGLAKEIEGIKDRIKETDREIAIQENLQDSYQKSSKALEKLVTVSGLGGKYEDTDKNYNSIVDQQNKIADLLDKQAIERRRKEEDLENQAFQARINAMEQGEAKIRAQRALDNKKEIQDLKRQREDYIRTEIEYQKKVFDEQEELKAQKTKGYKKKTFDPTSVSVDTSAHDAIIKNTLKQQLNDQIREQEDAWNEYLSKYGTFQQKKEAITRQYTDAINKAANAGEAASLQKEFEEALANLDLSKLKEEINWEAIFGDLSKVTKDQLTKIKKQLQEFKKSSEFKNATPEQIQVIENAINSINNALVNKGGFFGGVSDSLKEYEDTVNKVKEAQEELNEALESGDEIAIEQARKKKNTAENAQINAQTNVEKSKDKAINNITAVSNAIKQLGSAEFNLSSFGDTLGGLIDALSASGSKIGGIIAAILSLLDEFGKDGGIEFGKNLVNNIVSAIGGTIEVPFKMLGIDLGLGGANYSDYNEMVAKYDVLLDVWDQLLDKKKAYINESYGAEATKAGKEALDLLKAERDITRELASSRLDAGASAGSHSMAYRMWQGSYKYEGQNWKDVAGDISKALGGVDFSSMWNMLYMSADQLEWIKTNYSGLWSQMDTDFRGYLDDIIEYGETEKEIIESVKEQITGISFDSFRDDYISLLSDLDSTNKDFADNFEEYLRKSILQSIIAKKYNSQIQKLYDAWYKAGEDGLFSESEVEGLRAMQQSLTDALIEERERLEETFNWSSSSSQEASSKGFATMSQDSADELNGRFTALQISGEESKNQLVLLNQITSALLSVNQQGNATLNDMLYQQVLTNGYLEDIARYTKALQEIRADIAVVKTNTAALTRR